MQDEPLENVILQTDPMSPSPMRVATRSRVPFGYMSSLYEYLPLFDADPEGRRAATEVALCELMQSGVTTVCDLSAAREDWLDTLGASGMRVYVAPMFRSGRWYTPNELPVRRCDESRFRSFCGSRSAGGTESLRPLRWREMDSNPRSRSHET